MDKDCWFTEVVATGVNPDRPGIYEWRIEGVGVYIGQYGRARRPRREYARNVERLLARAPYRKGDPEGFREVHQALAKARAEGRTITLTFVENQEVKSDRNRRERELIEERRQAARAGGLAVLNGRRAVDEGER